MGLRSASEGRGRCHGAVRKVSALYNENDPYAARWLQNLVAAGHIASGVVSAKSIVELEGRELARVRQAHFFAGIGVWSAALRAAGWPDDWPVWTGSCPCQPFSSAGKGGGFDDKRHLWPAWFRLIEQHRPDVIFGEQVEGPAGRAWLDLVFADLEGLGYACGAVVFPTAGVGAPQIRHRTYWVARSESWRREWRLPNGSGEDGQLRQPIGPQTGASGQRNVEAGETDRLADADDARWQGRLSGRPDQGRESLARYAGRGGATGGLADADGFDRSQISEGNDALDQQRAAVGRRQLQPAGAGADSGTGGGAYRAGSAAVGPAENLAGMEWPSPTNGFWRASDWLYCRDNKWRPVEPQSFPLAHGAPARVGRLRAYGNAIVLSQAQAFIEAFLEVKGLSL